MKREMTRAARLQRILTTLALAAVLALLAALALAGFFVEVTLRAPEVIHFHITTEYGLVQGLGMTLFFLLGAAGMIAVMGLVYGLLQKLHVRVTGAVMLLWMALTVVFVLAAGVIQTADFADVLNAAQDFAHGQYDVLQRDYFSAYSYQLGICFVLEGIARLLPFADLNLLMQGINAVLSLVTAGLLAAAAQVISGEKETGQATWVVALFCVPIPLYCIHVYGTIPMLCALAGAFLCFALYIRRRRAGYALGYALCAAMAYLLKPNAAVVLLAALICALVDALTSRDWRLVLYTALGAVLGAVLICLVIGQYELRSGVTLRPNVSELARLTMGLQELPENDFHYKGPGWYNNYTEQFFPAEVSAAQEHDIAMADLKIRLDEMAADPVMAANFFIRKTISQWLEPTYSTLLYGNACEQAGPLADRVQDALYVEYSWVRQLLETVMKLWQQGFYVLCILGMVSHMKHRGDTARLLLPVAVLGGFLYHLLFEAKSQYIYVYMVYLLPIAGQGLYVLCRVVQNRLHRIRKQKT